jgi:hypothetical protein
MYEVKIKQTTDRPSDQARQSIEAWYLSVDVIGHPLERQSQLVLARARSCVRQESSWSCSE